MGVCIHYQQFSLWLEDLWYKRCDATVQEKTSRNDATAQRKTAFRCAVAPLREIFCCCLGADDARQGLQPRCLGFVRSYGIR